MVQVCLNVLHAAHLKRTTALNRYTVLALFVPDYAFTVDILSWTVMVLPPGESVVVN